MGNGMGSLYVGHSGLKSSQDAMHTVANNLANVNTNGYVRQQVVFRDTHYNNIAYAKDGDKKLVGLGTSIGEIVHARDIFLDKAYRKDNGRQYYYSTTFEAVDEVQNFFQELEGTAFQQILNVDGDQDSQGSSLWHAFAEFAKEPELMVKQNLVIQRSSLFVSRAQAVFKGLMNYQTDINEQISNDIDNINKHLKDIFKYNERIMAIESGGRETAMNERDARDYALDELSKYGYIEYEEARNGSVSVKFEGELAVDSMFCYQVGKKTDPLTGYITPYWPHLSNESGGRYHEVYDWTQEICTQFNTDVGELKALVQARGTTISNFNDIINVDPDKYDATVGLSIMQNTQAEFDQLVHGIASQINDLLAPNTKMDSLVVKNDDGTYSEYRNVWVLDEENCCVGADGKKPPQEIFSRSGCSRYKEVTGEDGKTYYLYNMEDVNDSINYYMNGKTYSVFDMENGTTVSDFRLVQQVDQNGDPVTDANGNPVMIRQAIQTNVPYTPWNKEGNEKYTMQMINGVPLYVLNDKYKYDTSKQYTTMEMQVNYNLLKNVTNLPHINQQGGIDQDLGHRLENLWEAQSLCINPRYSTGYTFAEYYKEMIGEIALIGSVYESTAENLEGAVASIENQRQGVIGVSSDEELTKMIKYQNAYNASSRYIQTVSDMIEMLVSGL